MTTPAAIGKTRATTGSADPEPAGRRRRARAGLALAGLLLASCGGAADTRLALWHIVDAGCNGAPPAALAAQRAAQCLAGQGAALLKDRCGSGHYLLIPTARRSGIESAELLAPQEPDYLALAWAWRTLSATAPEAAATDSRSQDDIALAVNSRYGRSQDQFHVHIDRLRPEVRSALDALALPAQARASVTLLGHRYRLAVLDTLDHTALALAFAQWGAADAAARARIGVVVAAAPGKRYFVLSDRADLWHLDRGHAEELLVERNCGAAS